MIHRVAEGESLDMYAELYHTSMEAIRAVNYYLPLPVWANWIIIIPLNVTDVTGIPAFEPYQASGTTISMDDLAKQLNTDAASLRKYNAFDDSCKAYSAWLLVPRIVHK